MRLIIFAVLGNSLLLLPSCNSKQESKVFAQENKAFVKFNEGISLSLKAGDSEENSKYEQADSLNLKAISKFKETLQIDSTHAGARGALGHSFYLIREYRKGIEWFEKANKTDGKTAANFRELGLCRINLGQVPQGHKDLLKAFDLDKSQEIKSITADDLYGIGKLAFDYGDDYIKQGEAEKGKDYKLFSLDVLRLAFDIDKSRNDVAQTIAELSSRIGNKSLANEYRKKAQ